MLSPGARTVIFGYPAWTPLKLGASLLGWWDATRTDLITQSGGAVSSWKDIVAAYDATQSTGASKPTWSATSFNGQAGVNFDGTDDELTLASQPFPSSAAASEIWVLFKNMAAGTDALRTLFAYGGATDVVARRCQRISISSNSRANTEVGDGASTVDATNGAVLASNGIYVSRHVIGATTSHTDVLETIGADSSVVPSTGTTRARIGANTNATAGQFGKMTVGALLVTAALTANESLQLMTYLKRRGGL